MRVQRVVGTLVRPGSFEKWLRLLIAITIMTAMGFMGLVAPALAGGVTQISGIAFPDISGVCNDPEGAGADFAIDMTGDLEGCLYVFVEDADCTPSGVYIETGTETYVGSGAPGNNGTFGTTYRFEAKFQDCANLAGQQHGRCQHPIIAGTGTDDFEGVTGRLDFKDNVDEGNAPYRGHLKW